MSQSTPCEAAMTCLNPHAHHISVTSSQRWDWILRTSKPRSLSREAKKRYRWLHWHATNGQNVSLTCRHHGISRRTFYPNLQHIQCQVGGSVKRLSVCVQCIRSGRVQRPQKRKPFSMPTT